MSISKKKNYNKEIVNRVKERDLDNKKGNVTFRLNSKSYDAFKTKCKSEDICMAHVIDEFIKDFSENNQ